MKHLLLIFTLLLFGFSTAQTYVRKGSSAYGDMLYNWDGKYLRQGSGAYGDVIANWDGKYIRQGSSAYADVLYNWDGKYLRRGSSAYGDILYNWDGIKFGRDQAHTVMCCTILKENFRRQC